jgi:hypothetical protein
MLRNMGTGVHYGANWFYAPSNYVASNLVIGGTMMTSNLSAQKAAIDGLQVNSNINVTGTITAPTMITSNISASNMNVNTSTILDGVAYIRKIAIL